MLHRRHRQVNTCHETKLFGPKTARIDHVFGVNCAFFGHNIPCSIGALLQLKHTVAKDDICPPPLGRTGIRVGRTVRVYVPLIAVIKTAQNIVSANNAARDLGDFFSGHQSGCVDTDCLKSCPCCLKLLPTIGVSGEVNATGHVNTAALTTFLFDLTIKIDGIRL